MMMILHKLKLDRYLQSAHHQSRQEYIGLSDPVIVGQAATNSSSQTEKGICNNSYQYIKNHFRGLPKRA